MPKVQESAKGAGKCQNMLKNAKGTGKQTCPPCFGSHRRMDGMFTFLLRLAIFTLPLLPAFSLRTNLRVAEFAHQAVSSEVQLVRGEIQPVSGGQLIRKTAGTVQYIWPCCFFCLFLRIYYG